MSYAPPVCHRGHAATLMDWTECDGVGHILFRCRECGAVEGCEVTPEEYARFFADYELAKRVCEHVWADPIAGIQRCHRCREWRNAR
jgi:hypothetical protein